jgi:cell division protein ZapE
MDAPSGQTGHDTRHGLLSATGQEGRRGASLAVRYRRLVAEQQFEMDGEQRRLIARLDGLLAQLEKHPALAKKSALGWLFSARQNGHPPPKGVYIWGAVGRGKSMIMDLFFDAAPDLPKRRVHFHAFMQEVHAAIHWHRSRVDAGDTDQNDPIPPVADTVAASAKLLCFDEFSVSDVADAMILSRLFTRLFEKGVVVVATSNVAPDDLYPHGLNRASFLKFVELLKIRTDVVELRARTDFRMEKLGGETVYVSPLGHRADDVLEAMWRRKTGGAPECSEELAVGGRQLVVQRASGTCGWFSFQQLCGSPLGSADYLAIAERFGTVFLSGVPVMNREQRNEAKRFINLIDTLYDRHVILVMSAEDASDALYTAKSGAESFEFSRTVSRLNEMGSLDYLGSVA